MMCVRPTRVIRARYGFAMWSTTDATKRDWKAIRAFSAFIVALVAEMYGFPVTI
jgi:hypothetical protein